MQSDVMAQMDAVVMVNGALSVDSVPIPSPGRGEVLVRVLASGICGSDLHCASHGAQLISNVKAVTGVELFDLSDPVVMGHEYCAEIVGFGPETQQTFSVGTRVASAAPVIMREPPVNIGFGGPDTPGAFSEYMVLTEAFLVPIPDNIPDDIAVLAEPLTVALHAVNRGVLGSRDVPLVIGCGPIGLAVIAILKARGHGPIVASDFSPSRRELAQILGADVVVDPSVESPFDAGRRLARTDEPAEVGRQTLMFPEPQRQSVVFECVGVPGVIQDVLADSAACSKVVVAGLCMEEDRFQPTFAVLKEIDIVFSFAATPQEYVEVLGMLSDGSLEVGALITSRIGLGDVPVAFDRLRNPEADAKVIVLPSRG